MLTQAELNSKVQSVDFDTLLNTEAPLPASIPRKSGPHLVRRKTGEKIYMDKDELKIGKSQLHADYTLAENPAISRVHCILRKENGVTFIEDNNSTNGTYVDGQRLVPGNKQFLKAGSIVKMGDEEFTFFLN